MYMSIGGHVADSFAADAVYADAVYAFGQCLWHLAMPISQVLVNECHDNCKNSASVSEESVVRDPNRFFVYIVIFFTIIFANHSRCGICWYLLRRSYKIWLKTLRLLCHTTSFFCFVYFRPETQNTKTHDITEKQVKFPKLSSIPSISIICPST